MTLPTRVVVRRDSGLYAYERALRRAGLTPVAGADEAGRGACAGPLVVAAVVLVVLLFAAAFAVARVQEATIRRVIARAATIKRWGGWVLAAVGLWLVVLTVFADFFARVFSV